MRRKEGGKESLFLRAQLIKITLHFHVAILRHIQSLAMKMDHNF